MMGWVSVCLAGFGSFARNDAVCRDRVGAAYPTKLASHVVLRINFFRVNVTCVLCAGCIRSFSRLRCCSSRVGSRRAWRRTLPPRTQACKTLPLPSLRPSLPPFDNRYAQRVVTTTFDDATQRDTPEGWVRQPMWVSVIESDVSLGQQQILRKSGPVGRGKRH